MKKRARGSELTKGGVNIGDVRKHLNCDINTYCQSSLPKQK